MRALNAGANLATINLTPPVNRDDYLLYKRSRHIMHEKRVRAAIEAGGLHDQHGQPRGDDAPATRSRFSCPVAAVYDRRRMRRGAAPSRRRS